jgi:hypothetical protein
MINQNKNPESRSRRLVHRVIPALGRRAVRNAYLQHASTQLLVEHEHFAKELGARTAVKKLLSQPVSSELIESNGKATYLMHGTRTEQAEQIMREGLKLRGSPNDPSVPDLHYTTKMMPAKDEVVARDRVEHGITYRYSVPSYNAKVVAKLDIPNPGTSLQENQFQGTVLAEADGVNILTNPDDSYPFQIPAERVMGYYNLDTGAFTANPQFVDADVFQSHS